MQRDWLYYIQRYSFTYSKIKIPGPCWLSDSFILEAPPPNLAFTYTPGSMCTHEVCEGRRTLQALASKPTRAHTHTHTHTHRNTHTPLPLSHMLILQGMGEFRASLISSATAYHPEPERERERERGRGRGGREIREVEEGGGGGRGGGGGVKGIECMWIHTEEFLSQYRYFFFFSPEFIQI